MFRAVASLSLPGGQDKNISPIFPHFPVFSLIFPQISVIFFLIFFLILVFRVGSSPTREGPGYTTGDVRSKDQLDHWNVTFLSLTWYICVEFSV